MTSKLLIGDKPRLFDEWQESKPTFYDYFHDLEDLYIIDELPTWCPTIRSKEAIRSSNKRNLVDPSIAVAAPGLSPDYFNSDLKLVITATEYGYKREDGVYVIPIGCLKN